MTFRVRWLGRVGYADARALQRALAAPGRNDDWLLLLEHHPVYTMGLRAQLGHVRVDPAELGAELVKADRGGDITYHGPGQLTGYPIVTVAMGHNAVPCHVHGVEQLVIDALDDLGLSGAGRISGLPGVWIEPNGPRPRKIAAVGVRVTRGRSMHGFALNVDTDLAMFERIVPCGIADKGVTSLHAEGVTVSMRQVVDAIAARATERWGHDHAGVDRLGPSGSDGRCAERQDTAWRVRPEDLSPFTRGEGPGTPVTQGGSPIRLLGRLAEAGVDHAAALPLAERKPEWLRVKASMGPSYRSLKRTLRSLDLVTVCEEAGCPNIFECWADGTATFMINGDRCTRACGFCLVDTSKPLPIDGGEPERVADAVERLGLRHAVVTAVARDDLPDGGAAAFAATIEAIHDRCPGVAVEVLIPDCRGDPDALGLIFAAGPEVLNHNLETVARLQRAVRPSASYTRSLAVLARARVAGLTTKSGLIVGMGETEDEVLGALADLAGVGVDIVTVGQYLRPTSHHLPVARWWTPAEFARLKAAGEALGIAHVEASPLTRSSYHAKQAAAAAIGPAAGGTLDRAPTREAVGS
jgi:lipoyl synthase